MRIPTTYILVEKVEDHFLYEVLSGGLHQAAAGELCWLAIWHCLRREALFKYYRSCDPPDLLIQTCYLSASSRVTEASSLTQICLSVENLIIFFI